MKRGRFQARLERLIDRATVRSACEVGVFMPEVARLAELAAGGCRCLFVEPLPEACVALRERFSDRANVTVLECAIGPVDGEAGLIRAGASSFLSGLLSPARVNDGKREQGAEGLRVRTVSFERIDPGDLDLLLVDAEGSEWYVLERMVSRPAIVVLELYGRRYVNPHLEPIRRWLTQQGYVSALMNRTDVVFTRRDFHDPGIAERIRYRLALIAVAVRRWRTGMFR